ncbi:DUF3793 family protein [Lachnobacterium bovis]|uniref:DUF3793 family protein n=1 Tax=Lachnobacterium bovis TaxID=140626 RepID=UPI0003B782BC|nr:DUF3793 family protein [Lachnobacterium bovis]
MSSEIIKILNRQDLKKLELQIIVQCTPVLIRCKTSNMLSVDEKYEYSVKRICKKMFLKTVELVRLNGKIIFFVYDAEKLESYVSKKECRFVLHKLGYKIEDLESDLLEFRNRYNLYLNSRKSFPHEMGIFLGYPIEDVVGFIKNDGRNSLITGYWKVYKDADSKKRLFELFDNVQLKILKRFAKGENLIDIVNNNASAIVSMTDTCEIYA